MNDFSNSDIDEYDFDETLKELFSKYPDSAHLWAQSMHHTRMAMSISDPHQPDNPLVYVNRAFCDLTGYEPEEVLGKNCRFLQGGETSAVKRSAIRGLIRDGRMGVVELMNYRKDGTKFWNALHICPLKDKDGVVRYFFGSQWNVTDEVAAKAADNQFKTINRELNHHVMNILAVVSSLVTVSAADATSATAAADKTRNRISALATAHRATMNWSTKNELISLNELIEALLAPYADKLKGKISLKGSDIYLHPEMITPLGLVFHELIANSIDHGFLADRAESADIFWSQENGEKPGMSDLHIRWTERFRDDKTNAAAQTGAGARIMHAMLIQIGGKMKRHMVGKDYLVEITLPMPEEAA